MRSIEEVQKKLVFQLKLICELFPPAPYYLTEEDWGPFVLAPAFAEFKPMPISTQFSEGTIWGEPQYNWLFRAFHDTFHMYYGFPFTPDGEIKAAKEQATLARVFEMHDLAQVMIIEIAGQACYERDHGEFPAQEWTTEMVQKYTSVFD